MKVLLVGNYLPDGQQSMLRFEAMLADGLRGQGVDVATVRPRVMWGARPNRALGKWRGYFDKYVMFPRELRTRPVQAELVHVVDHSNAVYVPRRPRVPWVVTCHDLLAVRGARGEDTDCPASMLGRQLQRAILAGLRRSAAVACDSGSTRTDLDRLAPGPGRQIRRLIPLGQNRHWRKLEKPDAMSRLSGLPGVPWGEPFLLNVGSNLPRKNKAAVVRVFGRLRERWRGNVVFCGGELPEDVRKEARAAGVSRRVFALAAPEDEQLEAAYTLAHALIFPSKCEGFGWPVIEAQVCGCPVICSDRTSLPEVAGEGGLIFGLNDEAGMADAVLRLDDPGFRAAVVARGLANAARFSVDRMIADYLDVYREVLALRS